MHCLTLSSIFLLYLRDQGVDVTKEPNPVLPTGD